jgi:hypothetical protein
MGRMQEAVSAGGLAWLRRLSETSTTIVGRQPEFPRQLGICTRLLTAGAFPVRALCCRVCTMTRRFRLCVGAAPLLRKERCRVARESQSRCRVRAGFYDRRGQATGFALAPGRRRRLPWRRSGLQHSAVPAAQRSCTIAQKRSQIWAHFRPLGAVSRSGRWIAGMLGRCEQGHAPELARPWRTGSPSSGRRIQGRPPSLSIRGSHAVSTSRCSVVGVLGPTTVLH